MSGAIADLARVGCDDEEAVARDVPQQRPVPFGLRARAVAPGDDGNRAGRPGGRPVHRVECKVEIDAVLIRIEEVLGQRGALTEDRGESFAGDLAGVRRVACARIERILEPGAHVGLHDGAVGPELKRGARRVGEGAAGRQGPRRTLPRGAGLGAAVGGARARALVGPAAAARCAPESQPDPDERETEAVARGLQHAHVNPPR